MLSLRVIKIRNSADGWMRRWLDGNSEHFKIVKWPENGSYGEFWVENQRVGQEIAGRVRKRAQENKTKFEKMNVRKE